MPDEKEELEELRKETRGADRIKESTGHHESTTPPDSFNEKYLDTLNEVTTGIHPKSLSIREEQITALMRTLMNDEESRKHIEQRIKSSLGEDKSQELSKQEILDKTMEIGLNELIPGYLEPIKDTR